MEQQRQRLIGRGLSSGTTTATRLAKSWMVGYGWETSWELRPFESWEKVCNISCTIP